MRQNDDKRKQRHSRTGKDVVMPVPVPAGGMPGDYGPFLENLKIRIKRERLKAVFSANAALILMYWDIGALILEKQGKQGWGAKIIDRLSHDLKTAFPQMSGFSPRNLKYMRKFADAWPDKEILQRTVAQIPWRSNIALMDKLKTFDLRLWYAQKTIENGCGAGIFWQPRSIPGCTKGPEMPPIISRRPCFRQTRTWPARFSRTRGKGWGQIFNLDKFP